MILYVGCHVFGEGNRPLGQLEVETRRRVEKCEVHAGSFKGRQVRNPEHDVDRWPVLTELMDHPLDVRLRLVLSGVRVARRIES